MERKANLLVTIQFGALALLLALERLHPDYSYGGLAGILVALALFLIVISYFSLRPSLRVSPIPKADAPLIQRGIYKYIRHPMYSAVMLFGLAMAIASDSWWSWLVLVILSINMNIKARMEDQLLGSIHPDAAHYQMHTNRFIPCLKSECRCNERTP